MGMRDCGGQPAEARERKYRSYASHAARTGRRATQAVPSIPCDAKGPVFREPWEAQAFAIALSLHERGLFTWPRMGGDARRRNQTGAGGRRSGHRRDVLSALAHCVGAPGGRKGVADAQALKRNYHAWDQAADRTRHGQPIELRPEDFSQR